VFAFNDPTNLLLLLGLVRFFVVGAIVGSAVYLWETKTPSQIAIVFVVTAVAAMTADWFRWYIYFFKGSAPPFDALLSIAAKAPLNGLSGLIVGGPHVVR